jgi:hypothetical protein
MLTELETMTTQPAVEFKFMDPSTGKFKLDLTDAQ